MMKRIIGTVHQQDGTSYRINWNTSTKVVSLRRGGLFNRKIVEVGNASNIAEAFALASDYATD